MTSGSTHKSFWRAVKYLLPFLLTAIFLYIAFYNVDFNKVLAIVSGASIFWIFIFIIVFLFSHLIRAVRWKVILSSVKPDTSIKNLFGALMVGYGVNCIVPRLGEISRAVLAGRWEKLSRSSMFGTVILERIIDIIFLGFTVIISGFIWSENLYMSFPWLKSTLYISMILMGIIITFLFLVIKFKEHFYGIIIKFVKKFSPALAHRTAYIFNMLIEGFSSLKGSKNYFLTILLSSVIMVLYALTSYIGFYLIHMQEVKPVTFGMGWIVMSISSIGVVIPTPGGTGSYHTLAKSVLVLLFGFAEEISLAYAFLTHIISYIMFIIAALGAYLILDKQHVNLLKIVKTDLEEL